MNTAIAIIFLSSCIEIVPMIFKSLYKCFGGVCGRSCLGSKPKVEIQNVYMGEDGPTNNDQQLKRGKI